MKKLVTSYLVYLIGVWSYFLYFYPLETFSDTNYAALAHAVYFSKLPLEWMLLYFLIKSPRTVAWIEGKTKLRWLQSILYALIFVFVYGLIRFPFNLLWFWISHNQGTSTQPIGDWFFEMGLDLLFYWVALTVGIYVIRLCISKFPKKWWLVVWSLALPVVIFLVYIQPVWIDPLYEDFQPMEEGPVRASIEEFTSQVGLEDATLLQVNMSEKVTTFNAYVTGIMGNARIVLWDTTIKGMEQDEILFILAHEVGHYIKHHVYIGVAGYLILSFVLLFISASIFERIGLNKRIWRGNQSKSSLQSISILLLTLSILLTVTQPISNYVSRQIELSADRYAIENTENLEPAVDGYYRMAVQSKSDIDPVFWVKWMRSSHPSIKDRIELVQKKIEFRETK